MTSLNTISHSRSSDPKRRGWPGLHPDGHYLRASGHGSISDRTSLASFTLLASCVRMLIVYGRHSAFKILQAAPCDLWVDAVILPPDCHKCTEFPPPASPLKTIAYLQLRALPKDMFI